MKRGLNLVLGILLVFSLFPMVSAGVGISWDKETSLVPEKTKVCMTYKVYNPWQDDTYVKIELSEELEQIISSTDSDVSFIPKETSSSEAIPVTFCFKTPRVYEEDCLVGGVICKQECGEDMKIYSGEVEVIEVSSKEVETRGAGGSATTMSVSAPLKVKVQCLGHKRNYSLVFIIVAIIAAILLALHFLRKKKGKKKNSKKKK
ncbi:hypothetical protein HOD29_06505 [archaeon]|jgi:hypothetical protein|nr:hypothetical protein [archaeon]